MKRLIFILEDDPTRIKRFTEAVRHFDPLIEIAIWSDANAMVNDLAEVLPKASLISLDHDLYPLNKSESDLGDGLIVAQFLAAQTPSCPVIIHSSNSERAGMMLGELQLARWCCERLLPFGDSWIETEWIARVRHLIKPQQQS